ncbi:MAG: hypothetical protein COU10_02490 [Candidatus Harrisonbacteria bacterium CG10_big_fil_rev_8_21_14_0_10_45_28]|uniref:Uncharacterized protein n=1 Tax=Candidatus Harrisonbacteria bacterium CG10_big_fil_rev_8_21_14_0_10_45_28 TaxID=1974586 RepID=A0A2H0UN32_9BACT|nr:MAG: hypothetical protein COU10_02490 [Candidatus Harrisonbacteria bacterium CG10_big_fil_rev_8_21_14_0_10_45_28]
MNPLREKAENLREQGYSYKMIANEINVAKSTLSNWFHDKPFSPNKEVLRRIQYGPIKSAAKKHNKKVAEVKALKQKGIQEATNLTERELWALGIGLYIGEGSKSNEQIEITNSDPAVIRAALGWYFQFCNATAEDIVIIIHIYPSNDREEILSFWKKATGLKDQNFGKIQIDKRTNKSRIRSNKLPYGTAHIRMKSNGNPEKGVRLYRKMRGWMQGALSQLEKRA